MATLGYFHCAKSYDYMLVRMTHLSNFNFLPFKIILKAQQLSSYNFLEDLVPN